MDYWWPRKVFLQLWVGTFCMGLGVANGIGPLVRAPLFTLTLLIFCFPPLEQEITQASFQLHWCNV